MNGFGQRRSTRTAQSRPQGVRWRQPTDRGRFQHVRGGRRPDRFNRYEQGARGRLRRFRQGTFLAIAITALLLMIWAPHEVTGQQETEPAPVVDPQVDPVSSPGEGLEEVAGTVRHLLLSAYGMLPRILIALLFLLLAAVLAGIVRWIVHRTLRQWEKSDAISALARVIIFILAIAAGVSIIAGDARAMLGSVGLVGLALSWALQTPIESFTGWLLNSFRGYYRVGDRIEVGDVFGDVYKIDVLTTTVWEAGGPGKAVAGAQATGAMITFPNWEVLRSNIVNYSRDFPYLWDEVSINLANETDLPYAIKVFEDTARRVVGEMMHEPAQQYQRLLERARIAFDIKEEPKVFVSSAEAWTTFTLRFLVPARERRRWASDITLALGIETARPQHRGRIIPHFPRREVQMLERWEPGEQGQP